jgi:1-deoxy-D-xylulose-5-phosphate reductoisomerase
VEFVDGSVLAQLGFPTMELPILYAMTYPERLEDPRLQTFDPVRASPLHFEEVDRDTFGLFALGERAGREGGSSPAVYNAANEVAVSGFLRGRIRLPEMEEVVAGALDALGRRTIGSLQDVLEVDLEAREVAEAETDRLNRRESSKIS